MHRSVWISFKRVKDTLSLAARNAPLDTAPCPFSETKTTKRKRNENRNAYPKQQNCISSGYNKLRIANQYKEKVLETHANFNGKKGTRT